MAKTAAGHRKAKVTIEMRKFPSLENESPEQDLDPPDNLCYFAVLKAPSGTLPPPP